MFLHLFWFSGLNLALLQSPSNACRRVWRASHYWHTSIKWGNENKNHCIPILSRCVRVLDTPCSSFVCLAAFWTSFGLWIAEDSGPSPGHFGTLLHEWPLHSLGLGYTSTWSCAMLGKHHYEHYVGTSNLKSMIALTMCRWCMAWRPRGHIIRCQALVAPLSLTSSLPYIHSIIIGTLIAVVGLLHWQAGTNLPVLACCQHCRPTQLPFCRLGPTFVLL